MWPKFNINLQLDITWILQLLLATLPGFIIAILTREALWLDASFLAACTLLSYSAIHSQRALALVNLLIIFILASSLAATLKWGWVYSIPLLISLAVFTGWLDNLHKNLRTLSSWLFIGCIYGGIKFSEIKPDSLELTLIFLIALVGVLLAIFLINKPFAVFSLDFSAWHSTGLVLNFKYLMPVISGLLFWHWFHIREPQWILWSSLSVVYPELETSTRKFKQRLSGVILGASLGVAVIQIIPAWNPLASYCCFVLIILSLRMFKDYFPGFILRCFLIVLYAGSQGAETALVRSSNVLIGGLTGIFWTWILIQINNWYCTNLLKD